MLTGLGQSKNILKIWTSICKVSFDDTFAECQN